MLHAFCWVETSCVKDAVAYLLSKAGKHTGLYYSDLAMLHICHNKHIYRNKFFKGIAEHSKRTTGWFYSFKSQIVINHRSELMSLA